MDLSGDPVVVSYWEDRAGKVRLYSEEQLATCNILMAIQLGLQKLTDLMDELPKLTPETITLKDLLTQDITKFKTTAGSAFAHIIDLLALVPDITFPEFIGFLILSPDTSKSIDWVALRFHDVMNGLDPDVQRYFRSVLVEYSAKAVISGRNAILIHFHKWKQERMKIGQIFRYSRPYSNTPEVIDGLPNYFHVTHLAGQPKALLDKGINPIRSISTAAGRRRPAILISSSPHKIGSSDTPWQDVFDSDRGHIRYYGDNKNPGRDPATTPGNSVLLRQFRLYQDKNPTLRISAPPVLCFRRVAFEGRPKGNVMFQGFGIIEKAEFVTQYDRKNNEFFTNIAFDFAILRSTHENEFFDWSWISNRRNPQLSDEEVIRSAPKSWQEWVKFGQRVLESNRRRVSTLFTFKSREQQPPSGSREEKILYEVYKFYSKKNHRFEALAAKISAGLISPDSGSYRTGWITPAGSDGGADFIGRLDVGRGFSRTKIIVLGQAKCENPSKPTGGNHIARTAARLRRGWIGVYVTTSYFSEAVQREVLEDKYPILLIHGRILAEEIIKIVHNEGYEDVTELLEDIDASYEGQVMHKQPEDILLEP